MLEYNLPTEIFLRIFDYLNYIDIQSAALVCRLWFEICQNPPIQSKIILTISNINLQNRSLIELLQKSFRSYINVCLANNYLNLNEANNNLDEVNQILENIGDTVTNVTFKNISFQNGSFYKTILNLKKIQELRILNCSFVYETFPLTIENRNSIDAIFCNIQTLIFKEIECNSWPVLLEIGPKFLSLKKFVIHDLDFTNHTYNNNITRYNSIISVIRANSKSLRKLVIRKINNFNFWTEIIGLKDLYNRLERFDCEWGCCEPESAVCDFISNQKNLIHLNLSQSKALRDVDIHYIVDNLNSLKILNLDFCTKLTNQTASSLFNLKDLEDLTIDACPQITGDGLKIGLINLRTNKLKKLKISSLDIDDDFIILLSKKLINLEILELKYPKTNSISDISIQSIIQNLGNLKELSLEGCTTITDFGITGFDNLTNSQTGVSIKTLKNLEVLNLTMCDITDFSIISGLDFYKLKSFAIPFNINITVSAMKNMILKCPNIECLDFQNDNEIDEVLEFAIKNLKMLKYINIKRICNVFPYYQDACVDRSKKKYIINIKCKCSICQNANNILMKFKQNTI